jgi:hypothetical protein
MFAFPDSPYGLRTMLRQMANEPNVLFVDHGTGTYYMITRGVDNLVTRYGDAVWYSFNMYSDYKKNQKTGKYKGVNLIGSGSVVIDPKHPDRRPPEEGVDYFNN